MACRSINQVICYVRRLMRVRDMPSPYGTPVVISEHYPINIKGIWLTFQIDLAEAISRLH